MKKIKLTQGKYAMIDDEDYERVSKIKWAAEQCSTVKSNYYARNRNQNIKMHRLIMDLDKSDLVVDHINHNTLDNRKKNLRICTKAENNRNRKNSLTKTNKRKIIINVASPSVRLSTI